MFGGLIRRFGLNAMTVRWTALRADMLKTHDIIDDHGSLTGNVQLTDSQTS